jgi:hypothetical protein
MLLLAVLGGGLVLANVDSMWSASVDLAHHYVLVFRLGEDWQIDRADPTLGEMSFYPRYAHIAAAVLGTVFNSPLLGLHVLTLGSLVLLWASYLYIVHSLSSRTALGATAALSLLLLLNAFALQLPMPLHGAEVAVNYFFSQMVAQALAIVAVAVAMKLEASRTSAHAYAFLLAAMYGLMGVHLLPALELLGLLVLLMLCNFLSTWKTRQKPLTGALILCSIVIASVALVYTHPTFAGMKVIAENNGGMPSHWLGSIPAMVGLCLVSIAAAAQLLFAWYGQRQQAQLIAYKYLGLYGFAIATLCLMQCVVLHFGLGSEYAIKKYVFGLTSFLVVYLAIAIGAWIERHSRHLPTGQLEKNALQPLLLVVALCVCFVYAPRASKLLDTSDLVKLERELTLLRDTSLNPLPKGKYNVVIDLQGQPGVIDYMFSIAIAHTAREFAMRDLLASRSISDFSPYNKIISSRGATRFEGCAGSSTGPLILSEPACSAEKVAASKVCKGTFDFSQAGNLDRSMLQGFSEGEQTARWTDGEHASIVCDIQQDVKSATIVLSPFIWEERRQRVAIKVNGKLALEHEFHKMSEEKTFTVRLPSMPAGEQLRFTLDLPDAISPSKLGLGPDGRQLGVAVKSVRFE